VRAVQSEQRRSNDAAAGYPSDRGRSSLRAPLLGSVPCWAKDSKKGVRPINAKCETAAEKPMFRKLLRERRCLVPVDWFYEWKVTPAGKVPHVIQMASREPFFFGGLWDTWREGQEDALPTFTILTTAPNELMQTVHDRMPMIVPLEHAARWLDRSERDVGDLLPPFPAEQMTAYPVSTRVNSVRNDGPELIHATTAMASGAHSK
jgi:putative SOS response-associated peptidase YedK